MNPADQIPDVTHTIELDFLDFLSGLAQDHGGFLLVRSPNPEQRIGASCVLRSRVGVEFRLDVEVAWEPEI